MHGPYDRPVAGKLFSRTGEVLSGRYINVRRTYQWPYSALLQSSHKLPSFLKSLCIPAFLKIFLFQTDYTMATPPQPYLDPLNQAFANQLAGSPPLQDDSIAEVRQLFGQLQAHTPIPGATRTSFTVPFEAGVKTFLYKPDGATGALPVIIYLHGGGWIAGK